MYIGVDIRTLLCPVKKVCEQPHAGTPAVTACAPFQNEREHEDPLNMELLSTEMEFTNKLCCSHFRDFAIHLYMWKSRHVRELLLLVHHKRLCLLLPGLNRSFVFTLDMFPTRTMSLSKTNAWTSLAALILLQLKYTVLHQLC